MLQLYRVPLLFISVPTGHLGLPGLNKIGARRDRVCTALFPLPSDWRSSPSRIGATSSWRVPYRGRGSAHSSGSSQPKNLTCAKQLAAGAGRSPPGEAVQPTTSSRYGVSAKEDEHRDLGHILSLSTRLYASLFGESQSLLRETITCTQSINQECQESEEAQHHGVLSVAGASHKSERWAKSPAAHSD